METPFSEILAQLESKIREMVQKAPPSPLLILSAVQLRLLHSIYRSMSDYDMREAMEKMRKDEFDYNDHRDKASKSVVDYFSFINVLNQFGRALKSRYNIPIPKYNRIRFFRNKVLEHWEEYTEYGHTGSLQQKAGEPAIPSISTAYKPDERLQIKDEMDSILKKFELTLDIGDVTINNIADQPDNIERIYSILESIDPKLDNIPKDLTILLFKFGFPTPIPDVKDYSQTLVNYLKLHVRDNPSIGYF